MELGERIYQLRTERNLSQGDLADALDVSRQSVSKWETGTSVPELDKLVKLCELFGVSLDELVRGVEPEKQAADPLPALLEDRKRYLRLSVGVLLLAMAVLVFWRHYDGTLFGAAMAAMPAVCGVIFLLAKRHPFLWAVWGLYLMVQGLFWVYKGAEAPLRLIFRLSAYQNELLHSEILVGWISMAMLAALITASVLAYQRDARGVRGSAIFLGWKKIEY